MLKEAYANKCHLIQAQLDKLYASRPGNLKVSAALKQLITSLEGAKTSLISLGVTTNLGDTILTHLVARQMDKSSREAWETSMTSANEYPTFQRIKDFVNNRVRALERAEAPSSKVPSAHREGVFQAICSTSIFSHGVSRPLTTEEFPM